MSKQVKNIPWTQFWDMHSGGGTKEAPYEMIYIQAPANEAEVIFYNRFGHSPNRVSCTCCGEDYSVSESPSLEQATGYQRNCRYEGGKYIEESDTQFTYKKYMSVEEYSKKPDVLVIRHEDIKEDERHGTVPEQGYVWQ